MKIQVVNHQEFGEWKLAGKIKKSIMEEGNTLLPTGLLGCVYI